MISRWGKTWDYHGWNCDLGLYLPRRGWGWAFGLSLEYEPHDRECTWKLTLGPAQVVMVVNDWR